MKTVVEFNFKVCIDEEITKEEAEKLKEVYPDYLDKFKQRTQKEIELIFSLEDKISDFEVKVLSQSF